MKRETTREVPVKNIHYTPPLSLRNNDMLTLLLRKVAVIKITTQRVINCLLVLYRLGLFEDSETSLGLRIFIKCSYGSSSVL